MLHLSTERLASLVDESPTPAETDGSEVVGGNPWHSEQVRGEANACPHGGVVT